MDYRIEKAKSKWDFVQTRIWMIWLILTRRHALVFAMTDVRKEEPTASMAWSKFKNDGAIDLAKKCMKDMDREMKIHDDIEEMVGP